MAANPEMILKGYHLAVTASVTCRPNLYPHADGWIKTADISRKQVAPGLEDKFLRPATKRGTSERLKSADRRKEVAARV